MISSYLSQAYSRGMHYERHCGDLIKVLWWSGDGLCLFAKRLERGRFVWPRLSEGVAHLTAAQLAMLLDHPC